MQYLSVKLNVHSCEWKSMHLNGRVYMYPALWSGPVAAYFHSLTALTNHYNFPY